MAGVETRAVWRGPRRPWRVEAAPQGGAPGAVADVRGYRAARRLRDRWRADLEAGAAVTSLQVPASLPGRLRPDLLDPEGFGEVGPDELAG